jgi:hypothetical protein
VTLVSLKSGSLGAGALRWTASIVSGHANRSQRNAIAASGTVIVVVLQSYQGYAGLGTALGTGHKCFTSSHTRISFLSRAYARLEKVFLPRHSRGIRFIFPYRVRENRLDFKTP